MLPVIPLQIVYLKNMPHSWTNSRKAVFFLALSLFCCLRGVWWCTLPYQITFLRFLRWLRRTSASFFSPWPFWQLSCIFNGGVFWTKNQASVGNMLLFQIPLFMTEQHSPLSLWYVILAHAVVRPGASEQYTFRESGGVSNHSDVLSSAVSSELDSNTCLYNNCLNQIDTFELISPWSGSPGLPDCFQQPSPPSDIKAKLHRFHPKKKKCVWWKQRCHSWAVNAWSGVMGNELFFFFFSMSFLEMLNRSSAPPLSFLHVFG